MGPMRGFIPSGLRHIPRAVDEPSAVSSRKRSCAQRSPGLRSMRARTPARPASDDVPPSKTIGQILAIVVPLANTGARYEAA